MPVSAPISRNTSVVMTSDKRDGRQRDERRAEIEQEQKQNDDDQHGPDRRGPLRRSRCPRSMKFLSWKRSVLITMSAGSVDSDSRSAAFTWSVSFRVSACGCLTIVITTPGIAVDAGVAALWGRAFLERWPRARAGRPDRRSS